MYERKKMTARGVVVLAVWVTALNIALAYVGDIFDPAPAGARRRTTYRWEPDSLSFA